MGVTSERRWSEPLKTASLLGSGPISPSGGQDLAGPRCSEPRLSSSRLPVALAVEGQGPVLLGAGCGGVEEMAGLLDESTVQWALIRIRLGSGSFRRQKLIFLHINGADCPAVQRGHLNSHTADVQKLLRGADGESFHASLEVTHSSEVTTEELLARVGSCFVADDLGNHSVRWARQAAELHVGVGKVTQKAGVLEAMPEKDSQTRRVRLPGMSDETIFTSGREALRAVAEPLGRWNWTLIGPDPESLPIIGGGAGSIDELQECLATHEDEVLFGVLRLGFGAGRLRRTKHVFFHANGARVAAVRRGKLGAVRRRMEQAVKHLVHCSLAVEVNSPDDLLLEGLIERLRRSAIIDDDILEGDDASLSTFSTEAFRKALAEERGVSSVGAAGPPEQPSTDVERAPIIDSTVEESVNLVHAPNGALDWVLLGPNEAWTKPRQRRSSLVPRACGA